MLRGCQKLSVWRPSDMGSVGICLKLAETPVEEYPQVPAKPLP